MSSTQDNGSGARRRRVAVAAGAAAVVAVVGLMCWRHLPALLAWLSDPDAVHAFVDEHAVLSRVAMVGLNMAQIVLAVLPGEPIELAFGYAFGFWEGTALCLLASGLASSAVFLAVRRWGWSIVGVFFDRSNLERFSWLQNSRRLELAMFIIFLIPGTPKDWLTYMAGLTDVRFGAVLAIATVGRIPSIVTSTVAAAAAGAGHWGVAAASLAAAALLAVVGGAVYARYEARSRDGRNDL